jgi:hypothetical protein
LEILVVVPIREVVDTARRMRQDSSHQLDVELGLVAAQGAKKTDKVFKP